MRRGDGGGTGSGDADDRRCGDGRVACFDAMPSLSRPEMREYDGGGRRRQGGGRRMALSRRRRQRQTDGSAGAAGGGSASSMWRCRAFESLPSLGKPWKRVTCDGTGRRRRARRVRRAAWWCGGGGAARGAAWAACTHHSVRHWIYSLDRFPVGDKKFPERAPYHREKSFLSYKLSKLLPLFHSRFRSFAVVFFRSPQQR